MEKVNVYSCEVKPYNCACNAKVSKSAAPEKFGLKSNLVSSPSSDTVSFRSSKEIYMDKLNKIFPNGEIDKVYSDINKDFGIDIPPTLIFYGDNDGIMAGGFTFKRNEIGMSLSDLMGSDTKIVGIKDGKRTVLVSPKVKLPLFVDKKSAEAFIALHSQHGNLGFDELVAEPLTEDEQRKFVIQKLAHEVIHAQQHMIMRQTEGMGEKEILKAWTHNKPKNMIEEAILNLKTENMYKDSYWADKNETEKIYNLNSPMGMKAQKWLEAVRNYPPVDSPEYEKNAIEVDAYNRSYEYANEKCGAW